MKKCLFEQWKARHQAYLAHKDDADIQAVDEGQTEQKIPEAKKSKRAFSGNKQKTRESGIQDRNREKGPAFKS